MHSGPTETGTSAPQDQKHILVVKIHWHSAFRYIAHNLEVDARLIRLLRTRAIPPPLHHLTHELALPFCPHRFLRTYTVPSNRTLLLQPLRHRDIELPLLDRRIRLFLARRIALRPRLQHRQDRVGLCVHDAHICDALVRDPEPHFHRHDLVRVPILRVVRVIRELQALAQPEVASRGIVLCVFGRELGEAFDVRGVVEADVLLDFWAAVCEEGGADGTRGREGDEPVGIDDGQESEGQNGEMHFS